MPVAQLTVIVSRQNVGKKVKIHNEVALGSITKKKCGLRYLTKVKINEEKT